MLSYKHAFHAGNHADVLKHACLAILLNKLTQKNKPLSYIDTHAGSGLYNLNSDDARKNAEFADGIDRLLAARDALPALQTYLSVVRSFRDQEQYPGSPALAAQLLRPDDRLILMELHNNEFANLKHHLGHDPRAACHHRNGLEGVLALCPPTPKRGLVLIDPPYELNDEYVQITTTVKQLHRKWPTGIIAIWYPLLAHARNQAPHMLKHLVKDKPANLFVAELWVKAQDSEFGMHGSGMAFINLPWQVDEQIRGVLAQLEKTLTGKGGGSRSEWLVAPSHR